MYVDNIPDLSFSQFSTLKYTNEQHKRIAYVANLSFSSSLCFMTVFFMCSREMPRKDCVLQDIKSQFLTNPSDLDQYL